MQENGRRTGEGMNSSEFTSAINSMKERIAGISGSHADKLLQVRHGNFRLEIFHAPEEDLVQPPGCIPALLGAKPRKVVVPERYGVEYTVFGGSTATIRKLLIEGGQAVCIDSEGTRVIEHSPDSPKGSFSTDGIHVTKTQERYPNAEDWEFFLNLLPEKHSSENF